MTPVEWLVLALVPIALGGATWLWQLHAEVRAADARAHRPIVGLSLVLALVGSIAAASGTYFGCVVVLRHAGFEELAATLTPLTVAAIIALEVLPTVIALYLRWARSREEVP